jgi:hypothetical protein
MKKKRGRSGKKSGTAGGSSKKSASKVPTLKIKLGKRKRGSSVRFTSSSWDCLIPVRYRMPLIKY